MTRAAATILLLLAALFLPYWVWAPLSFVGIVYFRWFLEAPIIAAILEAATTGDAHGPALLPIAAVLLAAVGISELVRPRLAARSRHTL